MGSGVLAADFVLAGKGVGVGHDVAVADLSGLSATVPAPGGAQDAKTKASTKPPRGSHIVLIERHNPSLSSLQLYTRSQRVSKHSLFNKKDPLLFEPGQ